MPASPVGYAPETITPARSGPQPSPEKSSTALALALDTLNRCLNAPFDCSEADPFSAIRDARLDVAKALAGLDQGRASGSFVDDLLAASDSLAAHPAGAFPVDAATLDAARLLGDGGGWSRALAHVLAAPAWQQTQLRPLADQPAWSWSAYARHLFAAPALFRTAEAEAAWAAHILTHLEPLVRMLEGNRGSSGMRAVAHLVTTAAARWPAAGTGAQLRRRQHAVGRLLTLLAPRLAPFSPAAALAPGMTLRVGIVSEAATHGPGVFEGDRLKTLLDPERFEVISFTTDPRPDQTPAQVAALRAARLDAVIFAGDLTRTESPLTALALHRVAARQFATALCPHTTGLPEIDGVLGDADTAPDAHTERVAVLPAALAFERVAEETAINRADFDLPADARLHATTVHPERFPAATRAAWQALLDADPSARILILPDSGGPSLDLLLADLDRRFGERLIVAGAQPLELPAAAALLRVSDTYLASTAPGAALHRHLAGKAADHDVDCLGYADALASVLQIACRSSSEPWIAAAPVTDRAGRHATGKALLAASRADRASLYLLAAVEDPQAGADAWHDLALALHANQQGAEAIQAIETCVRLDPGQLEPWLLLADWARDRGHAELVREIAGVVHELAPHDPRVVALNTTAAEGN